MAQCTKVRSFLFKLLCLSVMTLLTSLKFPFVVESKVAKVIERLPTACISSPSMEINQAPDMEFMGEGNFYLFQKKIFFKVVLSNIFCIIILC